MKNKTNHIKYGMHYTLTWSTCELLQLRLCHQLKSGKTIFSWTHWGHMMHVSVNQATVSSYKGLFLVCCHAIIWTKAGISHWDQVMPIYINKITIIGSDDVLLPAWCQAINWTNAGILLISSFGTNFNEILIKIYIFSFKKVHLKIAPEKWLPFCLGLDVILLITSLVKKITEIWNKIW